MDILVEDSVVLVLTAVEKVTPTHEAQLIAALRPSGHPAGLLVEFDVTLLKDGVSRRIV